MDARGQLTRWDRALLWLVLVILVVGVVGSRVRPGLFTPAKTERQPAVQYHNRGPAPILKKGPAAKVKGNMMATYNTVDPQPGDANFQGPWTPTGDTYMLLPVYGNAAGKRLWSTSGAGSNWAMSDFAGQAMGIAYYSTAGALPGNPWSVSDGGTPPAPTLAEYVAFPGDFPWPWWDDDAPVFGANTSIAPCLATLGGDDYLVLPSNDPTGGVYGFELFNLTTKVWSHDPTDGPLFEEGKYDRGQTAACYDVGDGVHIDVCSGVWDDEGTPTFTWKRYALNPGGSAILS